MPSQRKVVGDARLEAQRLHAELGTDFQRSIDVFAALEQLGIWLTTQHLGGLYGFYLRTGDASGVVLNRQHPEYLQRYTCAHELGHHMLGHNSQLDDADAIELNTVDGRWDELAAQAFAGAFLMPLQAINAAQRRLGIPRTRRVTAAELYQISRELDVSFSAAAWQMVALDRLSATDATTFIRRGAAAVKREMRQGESPTRDNRAGLTILEEHQSGWHLKFRTGDELRIRLAENASTGQVWFVPGQELAPSAPEWDGENLVSVPEPQDDFEIADTVQLVQDRYAERPTEPSDVGRDGTREFVFVAGSPGHQDLQLHLGRPWEVTEYEAFEVPIDVAAAHQVVGVADGQRKQLIAKAAEH